MNSIVKYFLFAVLMVFASCQNNGNIGDLFGTWRLDEYTLDGVAQTDKVDQTTFSFQSGVVYVAATIDEYGSYISRYGTWIDNGNTFVLDFTHYDNDTPSGSGPYTAPEWLGMTSDHAITMIVDKHTSSDMIWRWTDNEGKTHIYKLHKTW